MKIILLKDIPKVGKKYDEKEISDGYALNMLIPKGLAVAATPDVVKRINLEKARDEGEKAVNRDLMMKNLNDLRGKTVSISEKANEKGHLFAAVHIPEIIKALETNLKVSIKPEVIVLAKPIKQIGVHEVVVEWEGENYNFNLEIKMK